MDIRLKRYGKLLKVIAFILACVSAASAFAGLVYAHDRRGDNRGAYFSLQDVIAGRYTNTQGHFNTMNQVQYNLENVIRLSDYIDVYTTYTDSLKEDKLQEKAAEEAKYDYETLQPPEKGDSPVVIEAPAYPDAAADGSDSELQAIVFNIENYHWNGWNGFRAVEENLKADLNYLNGVDGIVYYVKATYSDTAYTNVIGATPDWIRENFVYNDMSGSYNIFYPTDLAAAAFRNSYIAEMEGVYRDFQRDVLLAIKVVAACAIVFLLSFGYIVFAAGRVTADKTIRLIWLDKLYTEFSIPVVILALIFSAEVYRIFDYYSSSRLYSAAGIAVSFSLGAAIAFAFLLSLVRRIKNGTILTHSLIYTIITRGFRIIARMFNAAPMTKKVILAVIGLGTAIYISGMVMLSGLMYGGSNLLLGVIGLASVPVSVWLAVKTLAKLTTVQEELVSAEMSRRLRAERLRTELISNVSHDIRTPLTSVITYVDLLKSEDIENEKARGYIEVIAAKSQRLKSLTDDLFEASKAASGNIPVAFENVNLNELITQGLGEMDAKIRESGLDFRVSLSDRSEIVSADGKLLWRVVENLLSNVFKYAMAGSRVYIETSADEDAASLSVKNISETELNIPAEELLERFKRGDDSRGGEGSGLGLTIAKSLTEAMGGRFELSVDGDLFKATVSLVKI